MPMLIEDKTVSGTGSFVVSSFANYYCISRLGFISILTSYFTPRHLENILRLVIVTFSLVPLLCTCFAPGDCYFFFCSVTFSFVPLLCTCLL